MEPKRRASDVLSLESLDLRLSSVEQVMEDFKIQVLDVGNEVKANTRLTEDIHGKTDEMYGYVDAAKNGFRVLGYIGNAIMGAVRFVVRGIRFLGRLAAPLFWICALAAAIWAWWKTGTWPK